MDGYAEQAEARAGGQQRWNQFKYICERTGDFIYRNRYYLREGFGPNRRAEGG